MTELAALVRLYAASPAEEALMLQDTAYRQALNSDTFEMPDPVRFARKLPFEPSAALLTARLTPDGYAVSRDLHETLARYSLVDARRPLLSGFGEKVRAALLARNARR